MRENREYTHNKCGEVTELSGGEFQAMSNPLGGMHSTYCWRCENYFPVSEFIWSDTGELISDYYEKHRKNASSIELLLCGRYGLIAFMSAGFVGGAICGIFIGQSTTVTKGVISGIALAIAGAITGIILQMFVIDKHICRRVCNIDDTRNLT